MDHERKYDEFERMRSNRILFPSIITLSILWIALSYTGFALHFFIFSFIALIYFSLLLFVNSNYRVINDQRIFFSIIGGMFYSFIAILILEHKKVNGDQYSFEYLFLMISFVLLLLNIIVSIFIGCKIEERQDKKDYAIFLELIESKQDLFLDLKDFSILDYRHTFLESLKKNKDISYEFIEHYSNTVCGLSKKDAHNRISEIPLSKNEFPKVNYCETIFTGSWKCKSKT